LIRAEKRAPAFFRATMAVQMRWVGLIIYKVRNGREHHRLIFFD
jgi:hypothetical protein